MFMFSFNRLKKKSFTRMFHCIYFYECPPISSRKLWEQFLKIFFERVHNKKSLYYNKLVPFPIFIKPGSDEYRENTQISIR